MCILASSDVDPLFTCTMGLITCRCLLFAIFLLSLPTNFFPGISLKICAIPIFAKIVLSNHPSSTLELAFTKQLTQRSNIKHHVNKLNKNIKHKIASRLVFHKKISIFPDSGYMLINGINLITTKTGLYSATFNPEVHHERHNHFA